MILSGQFISNILLHRLSLEISVDFGNMYTKEIEAFGKAVMGEFEIPVTAKDAIMLQKIIGKIKIYVSSRKRKLNIKSILYL